MNQCLKYNKLSEFLLSVLLILSLLAVRPAEAFNNEDDTAELFYEDLAPYGNWVHHQTYGTVWYPNNVSSEWRPYTDGYWEYTVDYGWLWVSDWEWGWAPFHYGRWVWDDWYGWIWVPGRIWAPAWVFWRYGGGYASWAPMPPQFIWNPYVVVYNTYYINYNRYLPRHCWVSVRDRDFPRRGRPRRILPADKNPLIFKKTRPFGTVALVNDATVNLGVPVKRIESASGERFQPFKPEIMTTSLADWQERKAKKNHKIVIFRPIQVKPVPDEIGREEQNAKRFAEKNPLFTQDSDGRFLQNKPSGRTMQPGRLTGKPRPMDDQNREKSTNPPLIDKRTQTPVMPIPFVRNTELVGDEKSRRILQSPNKDDRRQEKFLKRQLLELERQQQLEEQLMRQETFDRQQQIFRHGEELQRQRKLEQKRLMQDAEAERLKRVPLQEMQLQWQQEAEQRRLQQEVELEQRQQVRVRQMQIQRRQEAERLQWQQEQQQRQRNRAQEMQLQRQQQAVQLRRQQEAMQQQEIQRRQEWQRQRQLEERENLRQRNFQQQQENSLRMQEYGGRSGGISGHRGQRQR